MGRIIPKSAGVNIISWIIISISPLTPSQFAVKALEPETAYRVLDQNIDIGHILCVKQKRTIDNGGVFSFYNRHFKVIYKKQILFRHVRR
ncbi:hypothetical protein CFE_2428 [Carboxydocella thermautotrophica]|uniref:Uncharacterized protein n=1 Tax=Carboxydocella thermautotrophica TaxID=178899 RepID=A0A2R4N3K5_CARTR|nr:hypothetical protein CFE_2428 [Carboxydocella thermautotrophica]AVX32051.1 hypothetical protein CTH_2512 [Carboxydocella thermautotrophica]